VKAPGEDLMTAESVVECDYRHSTVAGYQVARGTSQPDPRRVRLRRLARQPPEPAVQIETRPVGPSRQGRQRDGGGNNTESTNAPTDPSDYVIRSSAS
jgi:hypothetical protein